MFCHTESRLGPVSYTHLDVYKRQVWNGLTDVDHPTQALADVMTIEENINKPLNQMRLAFCGDTRNNVAYCLMYICAKMGMSYIGFGPQELAPAPEVLARCEAVAEETGATFTISSNPAVLEGADAIYTDIWASMGEEDKIPCLLYTSRCV